MKILMLLEHEFPGDVRVDREVESLSKAGVEVDVAIYTTKSKGRNVAKYEWGNVISKGISKTTFKFSALSLTFPYYFNFWKKHITEVLKTTKYDYLHLHDLPLIKVAYELSKEYNIPLVVDLHENRPEIMKLYKHVNSFPGKYLISLKKWGEYQHKYVPLADKVILITPEAKEYYVKKLHVSEDRISIVPNYVESSLILADYDKAILDKLKKKKSVVYFGDISVRRGILEIMEVAILQKDNPEFHFVFIGSGSGVDNIKEIIKTNNLTNVEVLGYIQINKALKIIEACSIGVCPFHRNIHHDTTYANKMFQYMGLGLPLIVSDCPAQAKIVRKENAGMVFKAGDSNDLNEKLLKLVASEDEFKIISENNKQLIKTKYNWEIGATELIKIYKE